MLVYVEEGEHAYMPSFNLVCYGRLHLHKHTLTHKHTHTHTHVKGLLYLLDKYFDTIWLIGVFFGVFAWVKI